MTGVHFFAGDRQRPIQPLGIASHGLMQLASELFRLDSRLEWIPHQVVVPGQPTIAGHFRRLGLACCRFELVAGVRLKGGETAINAAALEAVGDFATHLLHEPWRQRVADRILRLGDRVACDSVSTDGRNCLKAPQEHPCQEEGHLPKIADHETLHFSPSKPNELPITFAA